MSVLRISQILAKNKKQWISVGVGGKVISILNPIVGENLCNVLSAASGPHQSPAINVESLFCDQRPCHGGLDTADIPWSGQTPSSDAGDHPLALVTQMCLRRQETGWDVATAKRVAKH